MSYADSETVLCPAGEITEGDMVHLPSLPDQCAGKVGTVLEVTRQYNRWGTDNVLVVFKDGPDMWVREDEEVEVEA